MKSKAFICPMKFHQASKYEVEEICQFQENELLIVNVTCYYISTRSWSYYFSLQKQKRHKKIKIITETISIRTNLLEISLFVVSIKTSNLFYSTMLRIS